MKTRRNQPVEITMLLVLCITRVSAQLSPGDLHQVHAEIDGLRNCTKCHEIGKNEFGDKCLACHKALKERVDANKGLHARSDYDICQDCHVDHQGRVFTLIRWPEGRDRFDHELTGYKLEGKHAGLACENCHTADHIANPKPLLDVKKDLGRTFLGLDPDCLGCHEDEHRGQLTTACLDCHGMESWLPASRFDHFRARFTLEGKHGMLACDDCHPKEKPGLPNPTTRFRPLDFETCLDCHRDEHRGQLAEDCLSCHDLNRWQPASKFDHSRSDFTLTGAHQHLECRSCHPRSGSDGHGFVRYSGISAVFCTDCHEDIHGNALGADCTQCHNTVAWAQYNEEQFHHDLTRYPLQGKHQSVGCKSCHITLQIRDFDRCDDCHSDVHAGQMDDRNSVEGCDSCHSVDGFIPALYNVERHMATDFPLDGAHLAIPCNLCHIKEMDSKDSAVFKFTDTGCSACHADPHEGRVDAFLIASSSRGCEVCHSSESWDTSVFDHQATEFPLTGGHVGVGCRPCHDTRDGASPVFTGIGSSCSDCHSDPHQGQFLEAGTASSCDRCHLVKDWSPVKFDHNQDARFSLEGAHERTECMSCHPTEALVEKTFTRFKPIESDCKTCHDQTTLEKERYQ